MDLLALFGFAPPKSPSVADRVSADAEWHAPPWLLRTSLGLTVAVINTACLFFLAGTPDCSAGACNLYESALTWTLLLLSLSLLGLGLTGFIPAAKETLRLRRERRIADAGWSGSRWSGGKAPPGWSGSRWSGGRAPAQPGHPAPR